MAIPSTFTWKKYDGQARVVITIDDGHISSVNAIETMENKGMSSILFIIGGLARGEIEMNEWWLDIWQKARERYRRYKYLPLWLKEYMIEAEYRVMHYEYERADLSREEIRSGNQNAKGSAAKYASLEKLKWIRENMRMVSIGSHVLPYTPAQTQQRSDYKRVGAGKKAVKR